MEQARKCPQCGQVIPWGQVECPFCAERGTFLWSVRRETFLVFTFVVLIALFIATGFAAKLYHAKEDALAKEWYTRGEAELQAGRADVALEHFRNALAYSRDNALYRLRLAPALVAAGRLQEGRAYLLTLWESQPGSGTVNLELARLAMRQRSVSDALGLSHNAIYGEWDADPAKYRREARLELAEFLLGAGEKTQAQSELIALAADLPRDAELHTQVGTLLLRAGEYDQALKLFRQALSLRPNLPTALGGAGEACFELASYREAQRYLERALRQDPHLSRASTLLETTLRVLSINPFERRLTERGQRAVRAFEQARARLRDCAALLHVAELDLAADLSGEDEGPPIVEDERVRPLL